MAIIEIHSGPPTHRRLMNKSKSDLAHMVLDLLAHPLRIMLPKWEECDAAIKAGTATALQRFIHENEPAGNEEEAKFREQLTAALREILA